MIQDDAKPDRAGNIAATPEAARQEAAPRRAARWLLMLLGLIFFAAGMALARHISINVWKQRDADVSEYYRYALAFWTHQPLFHSLPTEYPPLSIAPFTLTLLHALPGDAHDTFAFWMAIIALLGYVWIARVAGQRSAIAFALYLLLGSTATLLARFDLVPALVTFGALLAARRRRFTLAYALLAVGVLLKLYPIFLLPPVAIAHWQSLAPEADRDVVAALVRRVRARTSGAVWPLPAAVTRIAAGCAVFVALVAGVFALTYMLNPAGTLSEFQFAGYRPIQIESTPATLLWIGSHLHVPAQIVRTYQSYNYVGPLGVVLMPLSTLALVAGCLWVYWRHARRRFGLDRAFLATLCVVLVTNKLFSPQYLIWVIPFAALVDGLDIFWLAIALLTTLDFPVLYQLVPHFWMFSFRHKLFDVLMFDLFLRNGLLCYVTLRTILRTRPTPDLSTRLTRFTSLLRRSRTMSSRSASGASAI